MAARPIRVNVTDQDPFSVMNARDSIVRVSLFQAQGWQPLVPTTGTRAQTSAASPKYVVYGHAAGRGLNLQRYTFGIDTGCVYGRQLTAFELHSHNVTQVNCKKYAK